MGSSEVHEEEVPRKGKHEGRGCIQMDGCLWQFLFLFLHISSLRVKKCKEGSSVCTSLCSFVAFRTCLFFRLVCLWWVDACSFMFLFLFFFCPLQGVWGLVPLFSFFLSFFLFLLRFCRPVFSPFSSFCMTTDERGVKTCFSKGSSEQERRA